MTMLHEHEPRETQSPWPPLERKCFLLLQQCHKNNSRFSLLQIHAFMLRHSIDTNVKIFNKFLALSALSIGISYARKVFDKRPQREAATFLCNSMMEAYLQNRNYSDSFNLYKDLRNETCFTPDHFSFMTLTKSCGLSISVDQGLQLHSQIYRFGFCNDMYVGNGLIDMYAKFGEMELARSVFNEMSRINEVSWTVLIGGYAKCGEMEVARKLFDEMKFKNVVTWNVMIHGYCNCNDLGSARELFDVMPERNVVTWSTMIGGYAKCGEMEVARKLFDEMSEEVKDVVTYTTMMDGYVKLSDVSSARRLFDEMKFKNVFTWNVMIHGYCNCNDLGSARELFDVMPERNVVTWNTMIGGYCNCNDLGSARELFDVMPERNVVTWNTMIGGYCKNKQSYEAIRLFQEMQGRSLFVPDDVTVLNVLPAVSDLGAICLGEWCHRFVQRRKLDKKVQVCTAILDMYSKCGEVEKARRVFDEMEEKEVASWTAMIHGYALNGNARAALDLFMVMLKEEKPNEVTMLAVLSACNHGGLVEEGRKWFDMIKEFGLKGGIEHYGCMVDLLGRAGYLQEAEDLIRSMPFEPNGIILSSFLSACGYYKDVKRAERILEVAVELDPHHDGNYVLLRNLYAADSRWEDVGIVKNLMRKEVGCSAIEIDSNVSEFIAGDTTHPHWRNIHLTLGKLLMHMK